MNSKTNLHKILERLNSQYGKALKNLPNATVDEVYMSAPDTTFEDVRFRKLLATRNIVTRISDAIYLATEFSKKEDDSMGQLAQKLMDVLDTIHFQ